MREETVQKVLSHSHFIIAILDEQGNLHFALWWNIIYPFQERTNVARQLIELTQRMNVPKNSPRAAVMLEFRIMTRSLAMSTSGVTPFSCDISKVYSIESCR
jgi:hypothetical protein